jgi:peptide/nickel transport system substrate-binding protein
MKFNKKFLTMVLIVALAASMLAPLIEIVSAQDHNALFSMTIIAPGNANLLRRQWTQIFASNLQQLGIDAKVVYLGWTPVYDRVLTPPLDMVGKTYDQGGFDALALGWTPGTVPEPRQVYYGGDASFFAPSGQNYYLWYNSTSNTILDNFITSTSDSEKTSLLSEWQKVYYDDVPASQIMYQAAPAIVNPAIGNLFTPATGGGEGWLYFNAQPYPQLLTRSDGKTSLTYCATSEIDSLNPPESNSWYDTIVFTPIFDGLAEVWPTMNGLKDLETPALLTSWTPSNNGFTWTLNCRQGVTWHDGKTFSADDVVFSLWALMNADTGSQFVGYYQSVYGNNVKFTYSDGSSTTLGDGDRKGTITATDANTVVATLPVVANGKPYGDFEPYLLTLSNNIIPKHIFSKIAPADWSTSPFNHGTGSMTIDGIKYTGPVGTGPYKWDSYDPTAQVIHLTRNDNYWNATGLKNAGLFQIKDYYIRYIADKTSALAALKNGEVDMLDYNYQMQTDIPSVDASWGKVLNLNGVGRQEFGYNMQHPIFGTGVDTPVGKADPSKATEAARDVRVAFDYAIPRQKIINSLLSGYGDPAVTPMLPSQPYFDSSVKARPYDLDQARHYLELAGYSPPAAAGVGVVNVAAIYNDTSGNPLANATITLFQGTTKDTSALTAVSHTVTDVNGFFSFTVNPSSAGTYYYYVAESTSGPYTYLESDTVGGASLFSNMTLIAAIVVIVIIIVVVAALLLYRRRKH